MLFRAVQIYQMQVVMRFCCGSAAIIKSPRSQVNLISLNEWLVLGMYVRVEAERRIRTRFLRL